jgi:hypothetical protein
LSHIKNGENTLRAASDVHEDVVHMRLLQEDLSAKGVVYHRICYRDYTRIMSGKDKHEHGNDVERADDKDACIFAAAFSDLISEIDTDLVQNGRIFKMDALLSKYRNRLDDLGATSANTYRSEKLKKGCTLGMETPLVSINVQETVHYLYAVAI